MGKDVATVLGYKNTNDAISRNVDEEDRGGVGIHDPIGREQNAIIINESGLYSLVFNSRMPTAKRFKRWVTSEVLPSLRKTGGYVTADAQDESLLLRQLVQGQMQMMELMVSMTGARATLPAAKAVPSLPAAMDEEESKPTQKIRKNPYAEAEMQKVIDMMDRTLMNNIELEGLLGINRHSIAEYCRGKYIPAVDRLRHMREVLTEHLEDTPTLF